MRCMSVKFCLSLICLLLAGAVQAQQSVRIGTGDWAPYVDQQRADGGALGRLVSAVFAEAGYRVEYLFYPWDRNVLMLQHGELEAIMPYSCTPKRLQYGVCSAPLVRGEIVLFHRKDLAFDWRGSDDLRPYRIGTTLGYSYGPMFDAALQGGGFKVLQNSKEGIAFRLLVLGRIDLHPQDRAVGYSLLRQHFSAVELASITHHPRQLSTEPLRLLFRKDDPASLEVLRLFNESLSRFAERDELQELQRALYRGEPDSWAPRK